MSNLHETRITDPTTGGEKGQKIYRTDLMPADALMSVSRHFGIGGMKYEDRNWEKGYRWSLAYGALLRHLFLWWQGEDGEVDSSTGEWTNHLDAVIFHALVLRSFELRAVGTDDRPAVEVTIGGQDDD